MCKRCYFWSKSWPFTLPDGSRITHWNIITPIHHPQQVYLCEFQVENKMLGYIDFKKTRFLKDVSFPLNFDNPPYLLYILKHTSVAKVWYLYIKYWPPTLEQYYYKKQIA